MSAMPRNKPVPNKREILWVNGGRTCYWCGISTRLANGHGWDVATADHIIPEYKGGTRADSNLVSACSLRNNRRNYEGQVGLPDGSLLGRYPLQKEFKDRLFMFNHRRIAVIKKGEFVFVLQFEPEEIDTFVKRYNPAQDDHAFLAGRRIAAGEDYGRNNLKNIMTWKSPRRVALLDKNTDDHISDALKSAAGPNTPKNAVTTLIALHGVGIPMASAILTALNPEQYTVLDYHALASLGFSNWPDTVAFYVQYLEACRGLAAGCGVSLRNLDRALYQRDKEKEQKARKRRCTPRSQG
jgi:hypothetical protein